MGLIEKRNLVARLAPPLDCIFAEQLVEEFVSMERRFIQRDWEPTELDGGQFCEILARILYHLDSANLSRTRDFRRCISYLKNDQATHQITPRHDALHLAQVLQTVYKFRSQRGAIHISPTYSPNHMDAKFLIEGVRWCMNESLRVFGKGDREETAKIIRELLQFDVPCIGTFADAILVQRTDLTAEEEIMVLLHYAGEEGFTRSELGQYAQTSASSVTRAIQKLSSSGQRQIIQLSNGKYRLTDLGAKRLREELAGKLLVE